MTDYTIIWRPVVGYEGIYSVSSLGQIRNEISRNRHYVGIIRSGETNHDGYVRLSLTRDGKRRKVFIHRIVAEAFLGKCPVGCEVNHKNGIKSDNRPENLEYISHQANMAHAQETGLWNPAVSIGVNNHNAKLNPDLVKQIRIDRASGMSVNKLSHKYGIARPSIDKLLNGITWKHVK